MGEGFWSTTVWLILLHVQHWIFRRRTTTHRGTPLDPHTVRPGGRLQRKIVDGFFIIPRR